MTSAIKASHSGEHYYRRIARKIITQIIMTLCVLLVIYPFVVMLFISLKSPMEALISPNTIPSELHFENYLKAWQMMHYERVFFNTLFITVFSVVGVVIITGLASYVIAWSKQKKFYNGIYLFFLCGMMVPFYTVLVPLVKIMTDLHLTNSLVGMVLYYCGRSIPLAIFFYVGFIKGISKEILEAAQIDGASIMGLYWKILFPILKPATATISIINGMNFWNNFLFPRLMLTRTNLRTIALTQFYFTGEYGNRWELAFAAYFLTILPLLIFYFFLQKYIIRGVTAGAVKG